MGELKGRHLSRPAANWETIIGCVSRKSWVMLLRSLAIISYALLVTQHTEAAVSNTHYRVNNTALALNMSGGVRFRDILSNEAAVEILQTAKEFILQSFNLTKEIKSVYRHTLYVENMTGVAYTMADPVIPCSAETHLSANYVEGLDPNDTTAWISAVTGVLTHESTHVWQNNNGSYGTDAGFHGIIEGIANYMGMKAQYGAELGARQAGGNWSDGYATTAFFLQWIEDTLVPNFVNKLNAKMVDSFTADFFKDISGQSVDQLWTAYQAFLATNPATVTTFHVNNTALDTCGGLKFDSELGTENMLQVLRIAKNFIIQELNMSHEKSLSVVTLFVDNMTGVAYTTAGDGVVPEIHLSAIYVDDFSQSSDPVGLSYEITGVLFHESTHVWQNSNGSYGTDPIFTGVIEGIADFIRLRSQHPAKHWVKEAGGLWYGGYSTTAFFFDWIDSTLVPGFVNQLNYKMMNSWDVNFVKQITGESVDELWAAYQEVLSPSSPSSSPSPSPQSGL